MNATIGINKLKFVIFGAGHDYTLADSGDGNVQVFSHPFVPLNSLNYAGQWFFEVPDEFGVPMDAVKDDLAHCTFDPVLGASFDTVGETEVKCTYHREYIYDEETVIVEKTVKQKITVVDHGTVASYRDYYDLYTDGYGFYRPKYTNIIETNIEYDGRGTPTKLSSIPWRAYGLGDYYGFCDCKNLVDISELAFADVSSVVTTYELFYDARSLDLSPVSKWDMSNCEDLTYCFAYGENVDLTPISNWDVSKVKTFRHTFGNMVGLDMSPLASWDMSSATSFEEIFQSSDISDLTPLAGWNVSNVVNLDNAFGLCEDFSSLSGLEYWDVSKVENMNGTFERCKMTSLLPLLNWTPKPLELQDTFKDATNITSTKGVDNFDLSSCTLLQNTFQGCEKLISLEGVENWNVSNVQSFRGMFRDAYWIDSILPLKDWDFSSATITENMFYNIAGLLTLFGVVWDLSNVSNMSLMFGSQRLYYSSKVDAIVRETLSTYYAYDGRWWSSGQIQDFDHPLSEYTKDASDALTWTVTGSNLGAFDDKWSNRPTWN